MNTTPAPAHGRARLVVAAAATAVVWTLAILAVTTDAVIEWTADTCADTACAPEAEASLADARATDRLSRVLVLAAATAASAVIGGGLARTVRSERRQEAETRRESEAARRRARRDFDDAAATLSGVEPTTARALLERLDRATDADPVLDGEFGRITSGVIRHWDRCRRRSDPDEAAEWWDTLTEAVAMIAERDRPTPIDLSDTDLDGLRLQPGGSLAGAVLRDVVLTEAGLDEIDLSGADLTGARLTGAHLQHSRLHGAVLERADVAVAVLRNADLMAIAATRADFDRSDLRDCDLSLAHCRNASFLRADLSGANASHADFTRSRLHRADLTRTTLTGATLTECDLRGAILVGADLSGAVLVGADLAGADLRGADLRGADLGGIWLGGAVHDGTTRWPAGFVPAGSAVADDPPIPTGVDDPLPPNEFWDATSAPEPEENGAGLTTDADRAEHI
ncbi:MAG: pentapeptide repeat-containing protein [Acidimicrobiales bacterium]